MKGKIQYLKDVKVQYLIRENVYSRKKVPKILICGNWLESLGFRPGDKIRISSHQKKMVIKKID